MAESNRGPDDRWRRTSRIGGARPAYLWTRASGDHRRADCHVGGVLRMRHVLREGTGRADDTGDGEAAGPARDAGDRCPSRLRPFDGRPYQRSPHRECAGRGLTTAAVGANGERSGQHPGRNRDGGAGAGRPPRDGQRARSSARLLRQRARADVVCSQYGARHLRRGGARLGRRTVRRARQRAGDRRHPDHN